MPIVLLGIKINEQSGTTVLSTTIINPNAGTLLPFGMSPGDAIWLSHQGAPNPTLYLYLAYYVLLEKYSIVSSIIGSILWLNIGFSRA